MAAALTDTDGHLERFLAGLSLDLGAESVFADSRSFSVELLAARSRPLAHISAPVRLRLVLRPRVLLLVGTGLVAGVTVGLGSLLLQIHYSALYQRGAALNAWENMFRLGAPWQALIPVAAAAALALIGAWRLPTTRPEPTLGLGRGEPRSASELRRGLRRERAGVRALYLAFSLLSAAVAVRLAVYAIAAMSGQVVARTSLAGVALEVVVWGLCWAAVAFWVRRYREQLDGWGVGAG